ncbi:hypothetical protein [Halorarum halobium]|nr:hypothetical protein [Halobaculum sp. XH14]
MSGRIQPVHGGFDLQALARGDGRGSRQAGAFGAADVTAKRGP